MGVSIITPAYNSEKFLAATLESVLAQTVQDWELVVVNDGSTDQTGTLAETFARRDNRIRVLHQANTGVSEAMNRGFAECNTDYQYCMVLDSDDTLEPSALEILINALETDHHAVAAQGKIRFIDSEGKPLTIPAFPSRRRGIQRHRLKLWPVSAPTTFAVLAYTNVIAANVIMMRRAKKAIVGNFDKNTGGMKDWDMWLRLSRIGDIIFINEVLLAYRLHENNMSKNFQLMRENALYVWEKMYRSADLDEQEKRLLKMGFRYHELYLAKRGFSSVTRNFSERKWNDALKQLRAAMRHVLSSLKGDL